MFLMLGISENQKDLPYNGRMAICGICGRKF